MTPLDSLELAVHRALRGEVPPFVCAIEADLIARPIVLIVYHNGPQSSFSDFEEVIESELDQRISTGAPSGPLLRCEYRPAEAYEPRPDVITVYRNPWAG